MYALRKNKTYQKQTAIPARVQPVQSTHRRRDQHKKLAHVPMASGRKVSLLELRQAVLQLPDLRKIATACAVLDGLKRNREQRTSLALLFTGHVRVVK